jgi:hypothetical protein
MRSILSSSGATSRGKSIRALAPAAHDRARSLHLEVVGAQAKLYVKDLDKPALVMNDLKSGVQKGQVALYVLTGATYFSNFEIRASFEFGASNFEFHSSFDFRTSGFFLHPYSLHAVIVAIKHVNPPLAISNQCPRAEQLSSSACTNGLDRGSDRRTTSSRPVRGTRRWPSSAADFMKRLRDLHKQIAENSANLKAAIGTVTWTVTFLDGTYTFLCDAHPGTMRGTFAVGAAPPPKPKLTGRVGPGKLISLKTAAGATVKSLKAGTYRLTVRDATKADNFHLLGKGVNKKTGVRFKGSVTWTVTFKAGSYTVRSDASKKLRRTFSVK